MTIQLVTRYKYLYWHKRSKYRVLKEWPTFRRRPQKFSKVFRQMLYRISIRVWRLKQFLRWIWQQTECNWLRAKGKGDLLCFRSLPHFLNLLLFMADLPGNKPHFSGCKVWRWKTQDEGLNRRLQLWGRKANQVLSLSRYLINYKSLILFKHLRLPLI